MAGGAVEFSVTGWSAWAPGLATREDWEAWARSPWLPRGEEKPDLHYVPPMQRRRIDLLGRMAIHAAHSCEDAEADGAVPLVFASRHGDVARSLELLQALARDDAMSPTAFGLSVHNAIAALYSIIRGRRDNYLALAAGTATMEAACLEAAGLLADGAEEVRVVAYDAPIPAIFDAYIDEPDPAFAWCWRLRGADAPGVRLSLGWGSSDRKCVKNITNNDLPRALDLHRFLLAGDPELEWVDESCRWRWRRHD